MAHFTRNTEKAYRCVQCGSDQTNIVRESADPRLKCLACNMMFDASQSEQAEKQGVIPDGKPQLKQPELQQSADRNPRREEGKTAAAVQDDSGQETPREQKIPRTPKYVFVNKKRTRQEFCTQKDFKKVALAWESIGPYDVFELTPKKASVKIDIS